MIDATQQAILEAAFEAVVAHGYEGATTKRIAALAGVNEVTLFRRFGNKEALLRAVIQREVEGMQEHAVHYTGDVEADLLAIVQGYQDLLRRRGRAIPALLPVLLRRRDLAASLVQGPLSVIRSIMELLGRYQAEGALTRESPTNALLALMAPVAVGTVLSLFASGVFPPFDAPGHVRAYLRGRRSEKEVPL